MAEVPSFDEGYTLKLSAFTELAPQVEAYVIWHTKSFNGQGHRLLRAASKKRTAALTPDAIERIVYNIRQLASCLHLRGAPPEAITLEVLAEPNNLVHALEFLFERIVNCRQQSHPDETPDEDTIHRNAQVHILVCTMITIARDYLKVPSAQLEELGHLRRNVNQRHEANVEILNDLAPFLEKDQAVRFYRQPDLIIAEAEAEAKPDWLDARKVMFALWWRFETRFPLRLTDSLSLRLQKHVIWSGPIETAQFFLHLDHTAKGGKPLHVPIPESVGRILRVWLLRYRKLLVKGKGEFLFPGDAPGTPRSSSSFGEGLAHLMNARLGYSIRRHAFRHLATYMYLEAFPGDYEGASTLLGHQNVTTTINYYAILRSLKVWENFDKMLLGIERKEGGCTGKARLTQQSHGHFDEI
jgi:integrase